MTHKRAVLATLVGMATGCPSQPADLHGVVPGTNELDLSHLSTGPSDTPPPDDDPSDDDPPDDEPCTDTFPADVIPPPEDELSPDRPTREDALPTLLSEMGLYTDIASKDVHPAMLEYKPLFPLWTDGADKTRWVYIPECSTIDTSDMNDWQFPVGTRLFKEFRIDGKRIETRIIERLGTGPRDFAYASYLWNDTETQATLVPPEGLPNANGTDHDIPSKAICLRCHGSYALGGGRPSRALSFSALMLSHDDGGLNLSDLIDNERLSHPPSGHFTIPGDAATQAALGYLHANCGNCHNDTIDGLPQSNLWMWLDVQTETPEETSTWLSAVNQETQTFRDQHVTALIASGNPDASAITYRMKARGNNAQMPPMGTRLIDEEGLAIITEWIEGLP